MAVSNFTLGNALSLKDDGSLNAGGKAYFYEPGTATAKTTYNDAGLTTANSHPVLFDSAGRASIYFEGDADVQIYDAYDVLLFTQPNISPTALSTVQSIATNTTLTADHNGNTLEVAGGITLTLTSAVTLGAGWYVYLRNTGIANATLSRAGAADTINGTAASYTLRPGEAFRLIVNSAATGFITDTLSIQDIETKGADIASAATTDIGAATGNFINVTGTTAITALGTVAAGIRRTVRFTDALTLTHNATSLILPSAANITTAANDVAEFVSLGSGNWLCTSYQRYSGAGVRDRNWKTQTFTASGTFTVPANVVAVLVTAVGGGGGGGGGGNTGFGSGGTGTAGGATTFGALVTAAGGSGGQGGADGGGGGAGGAGGAKPSSSFYGRFSAGAMGSNQSASTGGNGAALPSTHCDVSAGGAGTSAAVGGTAGAGTYGGGGGGGGADSTATGEEGGGGGGSGAIVYRRPVTVTPGDAIAVTVGAGGPGGAAAPGVGSAGGKGGNGFCVVEWVEG